MATPEEMMLQDLLGKYAGVQVSPAYLRLYPEQAPTASVFANLHERLNALFEFMNAKARTNRHFNANESRELLAVIDEIRDCRAILRRLGLDLKVHEYYTQVISDCKAFLSESYGSEIPEDFPRIDLMRYEPVFLLPETVMHIPDRWKSVKLKMVGQGAFAIVYRYADPEYGKYFALKRAKRNLEEKDLIRFRQEFEMLKALRFPYVLEVYRYNADSNEYTMEYCDATLDDYIFANNKKLTFGIRKRIALQFLYGLNYLHSKGHLHRDVSYRNVLVKQYDGVAGVVKLADFGLLKERGSSLTQTESELRGTILDPTIRSFKEYNALNEIYAIGFVLSFIFSGRKHINACAGAARAIVDKCTVLDHAARYQSVRAIIDDVESLAANASELALETPA
ncbi:protein kinase family protein [Actinoplanes sp. TBRC 11911]|uniref:protein kinase family protein n=1 Tax=Actinoplanes sp. TBRC 11911 TaxID=2729386 RepID=UPI00145D85B2|nr:protein kinase family protein [Actinoplanes sp. TBRC 11911]NMO56059.1 protein kinase family protein [Actinoplanes sp. TBRC 11911]